MTSTEYMRAYRLKNRNRINEKSRAYAKRYYGAHKADCNRASLQCRFKRKFGLTLADRDVMVKAQDGRCKICKRAFDELMKPCLDHDHVTGKVRGILCTDCNKALGLFHDDIKTVWRVISYLQS